VIAKTAVDRWMEMMEMEEGVLPGIFEMTRATLTNAVG
jgi:hypothetical protein